MSQQDIKCINTLRVLGAEIINRANSGHPGIVLGAAPICHTLFTRHLNINSSDEEWFNFTIYATAFKWLCDNYRGFKEF